MRIRASSSVLSCSPLGLAEVAAAFSALELGQCCAVAITLDLDNFMTGLGGINVEIFPASMKKLSANEYVKCEV